jgi:hypothetical protein
MSNSAVRLWELVAIATCKVRKWVSSGMFLHALANHASVFATVMPGCEYSHMPIEWNRWAIFVYETDRVIFILLVMKLPLLLTILAARYPLCITCQLVRCITSYWHHEIVVQHKETPCMVICVFELHCLKKRELLWPGNIAYTNITHTSYSSTELGIQPTCINH